VLPVREVVLGATPTMPSSARCATALSMAAMKSGTTAHTHTTRTCPITQRPTHPTHSRNNTHRPH
jgi:hypothetical protein